MTSTTFFFVFIPLLAIILLAVNLIFAPHNPYQEKDSAFECGFHSFLGQNRTQFSISFFIFALLFLLFDLEILLVYPYVVSAYTNGIYGLVIMLIFFLALTLGFAFELGKNALKIDSRQMLTLDSNKTSRITVLSSFKYIFKSFTTKNITVKVLVYLFTLFFGIYFRDFIWGGNFFKDISNLLEGTGTINYIQLKLVLMCSYLVLFKLAINDLFEFIFEYIFILCKNKYNDNLNIYKLCKHIIKSIYNKIYIENVSELSRPIKVIKKDLSLAKDSDTDSPKDNKLNKGKGRALITSESDSESPGKKRKLDKGKGIDREAHPFYGDKDKAIDLYESESIQKSKLDKGKAVDLDETEDSVIDSMIKVYASLEQVEEKRNSYANEIGKTNNQDGTLWKAWQEEEDKINELNSKLDGLKQMVKGTENYDEKIESARYKGYKLHREINGTPESYKKSSPVSTVSPAGSNTSDFPAYNPADYVSDSDSKS